MEPGKFFTVVEVFRAVETDALLCHGLGQVLDGLGLAGGRLAADESASMKVERHEQDSVAAFRQRRHDQSGVRCSSLKINGYWAVGNTYH